LRYGFNYDRKSFIVQACRADGRYVTFCQFLAEDHFLKIFTKMKQFQKENRHLNEEPDITECCGRFHDES